VAVSRVKADDSLAREPGRVGRPKASEAEQRNEHILQVAGETFTRFGFDGTSIDAIAEAARISKRTLYARYSDKAALFNAVLADLIGRWLVPIDQFKSEQGEFEDILLALARYMTTFALTPQSVNVNRVIISESQRRPEFGRLANDTGRKPTIRAIASILSRHRTELRLTDFELAAELFMSLTIDSSLRLANLGIELTPRQIEEWVRASVDLFLSGARRHELSHADPKTEWARGVAKAVRTRDDK
jgi:TetR/AcrR family transcriptional regulator, mexJK operon transcriptional repressor